MTAEQLPELLYHYTDSRGFLGIVESKKLWASSIRHLNDSAEYHHVIDIMQSAVRLMEDGLSSSEKSLLQNLLARRLGQPSAFSTNYLQEMTVAGAVYVACFSAHRDDLSQWRAYGKQGGVCLALDTSKLQSIAAQPNLRLERCVYTRSEKTSLATKELDKTLLRFRELPQVMREHVVQCFEHWQRVPYLREKSDDQVTGLRDPGAFQQMLEFIHHFESGVDRIAPTMKHEAFEVENEYRLIVSANRFHSKDPASAAVSAVRFRSGTRLPIPYVEIDLQVSPETGGFHNVMVGPTSEPVLSVVTYDQVLRHFGFPCGGLGIVSTPYREQV